MAINIEVYSNVASRSQSVKVDFVADVLSSSEDGVSNQIEYFFKIHTNARDEDGSRYNVKIVKDLDDLALNRTKQAATNTTDAYTDVESMVQDYVYDIIYGHSADKFSSGVEYKAPLNFS